MQSGHFIDEMAAGTVGGVTGMILVFPLDTVKCRLQTDTHYKGMTDVMRTMVKTEGATSLYRGLLSPVAGFGLLYAMSFSAYGAGGKFFRSRAADAAVVADDDKISSAADGGSSAACQLMVGEMTASGAFAGAVQAPVRQVFERVKAVMQVRHSAAGQSPYRWSGDCLVQLVRSEGWKMGLFRGLSSTMAREVPQFAVYYPAYELAKRALLPAGQSPRDAHWGYNLAAGAIAGVVQWLPPIYSIDVIKTRMTTAPPGMYNSIADCVRKTYRAEGAGAFFRGLGPSLVRAAPLHGIVFAGYELTMGELTRRREEAAHQQRVLML
ncbi:unnamed protein product [Phaeothamnion confervicola]